jgi:hypothetical protein
MIFNSAIFNEKKEEKKTLEGRGEGRVILGTSHRHPAVPNEAKTKGPISISTHNRTHAFKLLQEGSGGLIIKSRWVVPFGEEGSGIKGHKWRMIFIFYFIFFVD